MRSGTVDVILGRHLGSALHLASPIDCVPNPASRAVADTCAPCRSVHTRKSAGAILNAESGSTSMFERTVGAIVMDLLSGR